MIASPSEELRGYLDKTFGFLQPEHATESYALEALKTERANAAYFSSREKHLLRLLELAREETSELRRRVDELQKQVNAHTPFEFLKACGWMKP